MFLRSKVTVLVLLALFLGLVITAFNIWQLAELQRQHYEESARVRGGGVAAGTGLTYALYAKHPDSGLFYEDFMVIYHWTLIASLILFDLVCQGYLKHVWNVLGRAGYSRVDMNTTSAWDVLWAHDYPFKKIREKMLAIKPGQKVNKFPGSGYITNKVLLISHI